ncbi:unnamed protein product [Diplocarpon coronariae]
MMPYFIDTPDRHSYHTKDQGGATRYFPQSFIQYSSYSSEIGGLLPTVCTWKSHIDQSQSSKTDPRHELNKGIEITGVLMGILRFKNPLKKNPLPQSM